MKPSRAARVLVGLVLARVVIAFEKGVRSEEMLEGLAILRVPFRRAEWEDYKRRRDAVERISEEA